MDLQPAGSFGPFTLLACLGRDFWGELWRAQRHGHEVALKVYSPGDELLPFWENELAALGRLNHERICRLSDTGSWEGSNYLVLEAVHGHSLRDVLIERGRLGLHEAQPILTDILTGLQHMQARSVVHSNIKPGVIYVDASGRAMITDLSSARTDDVTQAQTERGRIVGTPGYMAPEQIRGEDVDCRSDLYGFGMVLYEILTGASPFPFSSLREVFLAHLEKEPPALLIPGSKGPGAIDDLFRRLVAKRREERPSLADVATYFTDTPDHQHAEIAISATAARDVQTAFCPYCGRSLPATEAAEHHCSGCGEAWFERTAFSSCNACQAFTPADAVYCSGCRAPLTPVALTPPPESQRDWRDLATRDVFSEASVALPLPGAHERPSGASPPQPEPIFAEGTALGHYRVLRHLGRGGFGNVYLVVDEDNFLHEELALKVPVSDEDPRTLMARLQSQLKAWKVLSLKEPDHVVALVNVKPVGAGDQVVVGILMEHMGGGSLIEMVRSRWAGRPCTREQLAQLMRLFSQACAGVQALHASGLVHRDLKPSNFLIDESGTRCKLSDFELIAESADTAEIARMVGTFPYMAPECFEGRFSIASDVFALGASLHHLLSGSLPFGLALPPDREEPVGLAESNPLVPTELAQLVRRCLAMDPEHRPSSVDDLIRDLLRLGLADDGSNTAPVNLARLMLTHLSSEDLEYLVRSLQGRGFHSAQTGSAQQRADLIEEYCYAAPPHEVLAHNCTGRQLAVLARALGIDPDISAGREALIADVLAAVGFLPGPRTIPGVDSTRGFLEGQLVDLGNAGTVEELIGLVHSGLAALERAVDLLVRFYGQLLYGSGLQAVLSRFTHGKPPDLLSFGQKVGALRELCAKAPDVPLPERVRQVFQWPLVESDVFERLDDLVRDRNRLAHTPDLGGLPEVHRFARRVLQKAVEVGTALAENPYIPRVVQIFSRQDDVYGRHFYIGRDDRDRTERIFTPLPLEVGRLYLFYPITNPVRVNPLIFPYDPAQR